ncbi:probable polygalacturonase [Neltuma alba]|uniref:probable polygalacturonase n=1 Tax=Neltuma alba TaxID=207710 RepID=UPI0010A3948D|nr:probable polygalacturonase [Prosopis alba]
MMMVAFLSSERGESRRERSETSGLVYSAISCRSHSASLVDFGGVGDGKTLNTKAFERAISELRRYASEEGGGAQLYVPAGKWLTGSFSLISHFTLFLHRDAFLLASQDIKEWPVMEALPSYGRGRDAAAGRYRSLIFGTNLTDVIITGDNGTIDGQGAYWWTQFRGKQLDYTRPHLIEIMYSQHVQISNLTLLNSPFWNLHPVYSSNIIIQGLTIIAPVNSPNTDGIDPDSCTNTRIEDCYIISGDDCVAVKSGWDEYGIKFGWPTKQLIVRRLTCTSPYSAAIALGSEMSGGIQDVRMEDITAIKTESGIKIKTAIGRGGYVKDIYLKRMTMHTMKWAFFMTGNYGSNADNNFDPKALPQIRGIHYRDIVAEDVTTAALLQGISGDPFTGICVTNVTIGMAAGAKKPSWSCKNVEGMTSGVTPPPCHLLPAQQSENFLACNFPEESLPIDNLELKKCFNSIKHA